MLTYESLIINAGHVSLIVAKKDNKRTFHWELGEAERLKAVAEPVENSEKLLSLGFLYILRF